MGNLARFTAPLRDLDTVVAYSDFVDDQSDTSFIDTLTDSGTAAVGDAFGGVMVLTPSDGSVVDNDEVILRSANEVFLFAAGKPIYGKCKLSFVETTATVYNVGFGFMNAAQTDPLGDDGAGAKLSGSTAAIFKVDGGAVWKAATANNSASTVSTSTAGAVTATDYVLEIFGEDFSSTQMVFTFKVNGQYLLDATSGQIIRHMVTVASATEMNLFVACKLGASTNNDATSVDYVYGHQYRGQGAA